MKSSEKARDDMTMIRGIGAARQRWLKESLNVRTYQDLAVLSADEIESQLRADGFIPSRKAIEDWLSQARELAARGEANSPPREDGWKPFASFVVEFQTRDGEGQPVDRRTAVHHMEKDAGTYWAGIQNATLCQWMLDQIRSEAGLDREEYEAPEAQPDEEPTAGEPYARIVINRLRAFQPPGSGMPAHIIEAGKRFQGSVKGNEPLTFEVDFELTGPAAADLTSNQIECRARSYVYDQTSNRSTDLGEAEPKAFREGEFAYTLTLPEAVLQPGGYRLFVLVTPASTIAVPDYFEVPALQVA